MIDLIDSNRAQIAALCERFGVRRLEVFGSAASGSFDPGRSDVDFLLDFGEGYDPALFTRYFELKEALEKLLGRKVDLVMLGALKNPYFIESVNRTRKPVYAAPVGEAA
ncbi:MAG: nucleotidyltransferase family protein [Burkholderiales bacterium]